jgi:hypothetical protein
LFIHFAMKSDKILQDKSLTFFRANSHSFVLTTLVRFAWILRHNACSFTGLIRPDDSLVHRNIIGLMTFNGRVDTIVAVNVVLHEISPYKSEITLCVAHRSLCGGDEFS